MKNLLVFLLLLFIPACNSLENHKNARQNADFVIENLVDYDAIRPKLPEKFFPANQTKGFIDQIKNNCDWQNRKGKFVDYFTMGNAGGPDQTAFIYEYFLDCDSLRFILIFNMPAKGPELVKIRIDPIEAPCDMIIDPSKHLLPQ